jgi:large subunit ribosomal protein L25
MSTVKQLAAVARDRAGKGAARAVRREGRVPAVIYGGGQPPVTISLDFNQTKRLIYAGKFMSTIFEIDVNGQKTKAIPRDYQLDVVKDTPIHVDFLRLSEGQLIKVEVPVHILGQDVCPGIKQGGVLQITEHSIELLCPVESIPESVDVDISKLGFGISVHINNIELPKGIKPVSRENLTLITITVPRGAEDAAKS